MNRYILVLSLAVGILLAPAQGAGQPSATPDSHSEGSGPHVCARCVRAHMDFLASDALRGRGSGTQDELIAATYLASELEQYGVAPAGDQGGYIQRVTVLKRRVTAPPQVRLKPAAPPDHEITWTHGKEMLALYLGATAFSGPLHKIEAGKTEDQRITPGSVIYLTGNPKGLQEAAFAYGSEGAAAVIIPASERLQSRWASVGARLPSLPARLEGASQGDLGESFSFLAVNPEAAAALGKLPDGTMITMQAPVSEPETSHTWNVVGKIGGTAPAQRQEVVLLTAHLDHLGVGVPVRGDDIYNGADDDASGTTAVLELARLLAAEPKPKRTVILALFGSEEAGGLGSTYFRQHPPVPLKDIAAYLEFEMIGRPDPTVARDTLWLTGWNRTDLGPALAAHGAHLVPDPHPNQDFFRRSDNYVFAKQGVIAQTVSSYGLHSDYHTPSDDLAHIDFKHMNEAIGSMLKPVLWLVNSDFVPRWKEGGKP